MFLQEEGLNPDYTPPSATATDDTDDNPVVYTEPAVVSGLTIANVSEFLIFKAFAQDATGNNATCQYTVEIRGK